MSYGQIDFCQEAQSLLIRKGYLAYEEVLIETYIRKRGREVVAFLRYRFPRYAKRRGNLENLF